ncbi:MAG TPA: hypothetical protein VHE35_00360 [Kofleriaceae bacterium]|nr:hypothetical protein [Kofleriaceae bacterium]
MTPAAGDVVDLDAAEVEGGSYGASFGGATLGAEPLDRGGGGDEDGDDLRDDDEAPR